MSPVSRRRKPKKTRTRKRRKVAASNASAASTAPPTFVDNALRIVAGISDCDDPLQAEFLAAALLSDRSDLTEFLAHKLIPAIAERDAPDAVALVLALGAVADGKVAEAATAGLDRLVANGAQAPAWADELREPITSSGHRRIVLLPSTLTVLACEFHRGQRTHAVQIITHGTDCGAAVSITLERNRALQDLLDRVETQFADDVYDITTEDLDAAEFRRQVVHALNARRDHELTSGVDETEDDERWPGYHALALLLHRWLESMPESDRPPTPHGKCARPQGASSPLRRKKLPPARTEADGPAPVFQLRVSLAGSRPPIWRRLEVPADIMLDELHGVIQVAFEWDDYHPYAFVTDYGVFGPPDSALPVRSDESVTLEQVAPGENATIQYLYDFEDCWEHDIVVEKVVKPEPGVVYPRCASGRCAAPPEESGGMQGYLDLLAILDDPDHPEHANTLDRFELDSAEEFDPTWFLPGEVNWALGAAR